MSKEKRPKLEDTLDKEIESMENIEGFDVGELQVGQALELVTQSRTYLIERLEDGFYLSSQPPHPNYCPVSTKAEILGSTLTKESSAIKVHFVGKGMHLEFSVPGHKNIRTTQIKDVRIAKRTVQ